MKEDYETKFYETQQEKAEVELEIEKARLKIAQTEVQQVDVRLQMDKVAMEFKRLELDNLKNKEDTPETTSNLINLRKSHRELNQLSTDLRIMKKRREIQDYTNLH